MSLEIAAALLTKAAGDPVTVEMLEADRLAGAPANPDGTLNLVHYAAWLVREHAPDARASGQMLLAQLATWHGDRRRALACYATAEALWDSVGMYLAHVARERMAELEAGPAYTARRELARAWAHAQRIQRSDRFFRTCAPIDASMLGRGTR